MSIKPAVLDAMVAAGCTAEQIAAAIKADMGTRSTNAERQAAFRARQKALRNNESNVTSVTVTDALSPKKETSPTPPKEKTTPIPEPSGSSKKRATRLPDDFAPDLQHAADAGLSNGEAVREVDRFRDYWRSAPGQKGVKADWPATWRNWCRKAADDRRAPVQRATAPPKPRERSVSDVLGEIAAGTWTGPKNEPDEPFIETSFSRRN